MSIMVFPREFNQYHHAQLIWANLSRVQWDQEQEYILKSQATPTITVQIKIRIWIKIQVIPICL